MSLALIKAIETNDIKAVTALLAEGVDLNCVCGPDYPISTCDIDQSMQNDTPLLLAIKKNHHEIVDLLISYISTHKEFKPILNKGSWLGENTKTNPLSKITPLVVAIANSNLGLVNKLLQHGADPNYFEQGIVPPLIVNLTGKLKSLPNKPSYTLPLNNEEKKILQLLLEHGANPYLPYGLESEVVNSTAVDAFAKAIDNGDPEVLAILTACEESTVKNKIEQDFFKKIQIIKRAGHRLGLRGIISVMSSSVKIPVFTEGVSQYASSVTLLEDVTAYCNFLDEANKKNSGELTDQSKNAAKNYMDEIEAALVFNNKTMGLQHEKAVKVNHDQYHDIMAKESHDRYKQGKLLFLTTGWKGHGIGIVLYKDYLILSNRGQGRLETGTTIYKVSNVNAITPDLIKKLIKGRDGPLIRQEVMTALEGIVNIDNPIARLPSKQQKWGTCSYVNIKAAVEGIMFVKDYEARMGSNPNAQDNITKAAEFARKEYKIFTQLIREKEVTRLIQEYKLAKAGKAKDPNLHQIYKDLFYYVLKEHHGVGKNPIVNENRSYKMKKHSTELDRALKILQALEDDQNEVLKRLKGEELYLAFIADSHGNQELLELLGKVAVRMRKMLKIS